MTHNNLFVDERVGLNLISRRHLKKNFHSTKISAVLPTKYELTTFNRV